MERQEAQRKGAFRVARIRTIKPDFWTDEKIVRLPMAARLLFIGMWNFTDDEGYMRYEPGRIKMQIFPADNVDIEELLEALADCELILIRRCNDGREVVFIPNFLEHQKISNPSKSKLAAAISLEDSRGLQRTLEESEGISAEGSGRKRKEGREILFTEGEGEAEGKQEPAVRLPPLDVSGVDWGWVTRVASDVAKRIPPQDDSDRRQWIRFAVLAWTTFSEGWLLDAAEAVVNAKEHRGKRQAHFVGVVKSKAVQDGINVATLRDLMKRIEIPSEVWKSKAVRVLQAKG